MTERAAHLYQARVYLAQARVSRRFGGWHATLLKWVAKHRLAALRERRLQGSLAL